MTKIRIDTEHAREVARRLIAESERMTEMDRELGGAINGLNTGAWDGHTRYRAEPMLNQVQPESRHIAEELDTLGRKLLNVADTFEVEDSTAAQSFEGIGWVDFDTNSSTASTVTVSTPSISHKGVKGNADRTLLEQLGNAGGDLGLGMDVITTLPILGLLSVKHMSGLSGKILKDAWSLGGKNLVRTWRDMSSTSIDDLLEGTMETPGNLKNWGAAALVIGSVCEVVSETGENWQEYDGDPGKFAGGLLFDSVLGIGASVAGGAGGTIVGAVIGGTLGSVVPFFGTSAGAVVGGKIGAIAGGWIAGKKVEDLEDVKVHGQELDKTVAGAVDRGLDAIADGVASLF